MATSGVFCGNKADMLSLVERQLAGITHRDVVAILLAQRAADAKPDRRVIAHHPLCRNRFIDINIPGTSQAQALDPLGHEIARLLMQIRNVSRVEAGAEVARKAAATRREKGRC